MNEGPNFLKQKHNLHNTPEVESAANRTQARTDEKVPQAPAERIQNYIDRFKEIVERKDPYKKEQGIKALKHVLHDKFVIKEAEIPESYFKLQKRIAREQGHGYIEIEEEQRKQLAEVIRTDQEGTMDMWIDYLSSKDATYPDWLKYYAFRGMLGMSTYDKEKKSFGKRTKDTTTPFPDLNREALASVLDAIEKHAKKEKVNISLLKEDQEQFKKILKEGNFSKLYALAIENITPASVEALTHTEGKWVKYDRDTDHVPLVQSLQGHGTGWCTAGESTAQTQLQNGDFYVYYSFDENGEPTVPRVAIRMENDKIGEVRGIAEQQNIDSYITPVVEEKLAEFPDGEEYKKKTSDMKRLTGIENKTKREEELSKDDLMFLYETNSNIDGFGYKKDPRIKEQLEGRNTKKDLSFALGVSEDKISTTKEEAPSGDIVFHYGDLDFAGLTSAKRLVLPKSVSGNLNLQSLTSVDGVVMPEYVGGSISLKGLTNGDGLVMPKHVTYNVYLSKLTDGDGLIMPEYVGGNVRLDGLKNGDGMVMPKHVTGYIGLQSLTSGDGMVMPEYVGDDLDISSLENGDGMVMPKHVSGNVYLLGLTSGDGLVIPKSFSGKIYFHKLPDKDFIELQKRYPQHADKMFRIKQTAKTQRGHI